MKRRSLRYGFTYVEMLFVVAIVGVLLAIGLPRYFRAQTSARQSEAVTNLKSLAASLRTQQSKPYSIHVNGFDPPRGNRYTYLVDSGCSATEDRAAVDASQHNSDTCVGSDTFAYPTFPSTFYPVQVTDYTWSSSNGPSLLGNSAGYYGYDGYCGGPGWEFLAYAAGDVDDTTWSSSGMDGADSWLVSSTDGYLASVCPAGSAAFAPAGEPFMVYDDASCN